MTPGHGYLHGKIWGKTAGERARIGRRKYGMTGRVEKNGKGEILGEKKAREARCSIS